MLQLAVLTAAAVFNVGVINPGTHAVESYIACDIDYNTALATVSQEQPFYPDKVLAIFDDDARAANVQGKETACPAIESSMTPPAKG